MSDLTTIIAAILAAVVAIAGAWLRGKATGQRQEQDKRVRQDLDAVRKAKGVQDEIDRASPDDVRRRLDGWMRPDGD